MIATKRLEAQAKHDALYLAVSPQCILGAAYQCGESGAIASSLIVPLGLTADAAAGTLLRAFPPRTHRPGEVIYSLPHYIAAERNRDEDALLHGVMLYCKLVGARIRLTCREAVQDLENEYSQPPHNRAHLPRFHQMSGVPYIQGAALTTAVWDARLQSEGRRLGRREPLGDIIVKTKNPRPFRATDAKALRKAVALVEAEIKGAAR